MLIISRDFDARFNETKADLKNYVDTKFYELDTKFDAKFNALEAQNNSIIIGFSIFAVVITFASIFIPGLMAWLSNYFTRHHENNTMTRDEIIELVNNQLSR
ncbi:MAG: hypothetical protein IJT21_08585 [Synergistaceae bacterium]|nr:hypothetical protein [Synergistaceae bacterium]